MPGGFAQTMLGPFGTPEQEAELAARYGLDQPVFVQYGHWLAAVARGDLGISMISQQPVAAELAARLPVTGELTLFGWPLAVVVGVPLGVLDRGPGPAGRRRGGRPAAQRDRRERAGVRARQPGGVRVLPVRARPHRWAGTRRSAQDRGRQPARRWCCRRRAVRSWPSRSRRAPPGTPCSACWSSRTSRPPSPAERRRGSSSATMCCATRPSRSSRCSATITAYLLGGARHHRVPVQPARHRLVRGAGGRPPGLRGGAGRGAARGRPCSSCSTCSSTSSPGCSIRATA